MFVNYRLHKYHCMLDFGSFLDSFGEIMPKLFLALMAGGVFLIREGKCHKLHDDGAKDFFRLA